MKVRYWMDNMDFNKYWNNRIYTNEERLELAKELYNKNNFSFSPEACKALSIIAERMKNIEEKLEEETE